MTPAGPPEPVSPGPGRSLTCVDLVELVTGFVEHGLSDNVRARFVDHLKICPGCEVYLDQIRATMAVTGTLRGADLDPDLTQRLLAAFRAARGDGPPPV